MTLAFLLQAVTFGDVNGDGELEVVFGANSGYLYALSGKTGLDIPNFPFRTHGRIAASVLITQLSRGLSQQLVVMSFDGHLYMVDGISGVVYGHTAMCCATCCTAWPVLCCAVLCCAVLCCAVLCCAVLRRAAPCRAVPCRAVLCCAVPCCAFSCSLHVCSRPTRYFI